MTSPTKVSVVVPFFNRARFLGEAVESILATGYPSLEILLVDDGSSDESGAVAAGLARSSPGVVRLLRHPDGGNHGAAASRDLGVSQATGEYICFLDSDDYVFPHRFRTAVDLLDARRDVDGVFEPTLRVVESGGEQRSGRVRAFIDFDCDDPDRVLETILTQQRHWSMNAITIRRTAFERAGGFGGATRENAPEDLYLWLKLACTARLVRGSREAVAVYRIHDGNMSSRVDVQTTTGPLAAYVATIRWLRAPSSDPRRQLLSRAAKEKLFYVAARLREQRAHGAAIAVLLSTAVSLPSVVLERRFWANLMRTGMTLPRGARQ